MECNFSKNRCKNKGAAKIDNQEIPQSNHFCYFSSIIYEKGKIEKDVIQRIRVGWGKVASGVVCEDKYH